MNFLKYPFSSFERRIDTGRLNGDIVTVEMLMPTVTQDEILMMVELQLGKRDVRENDRLVETLGAESADVANLVAAAEEKFGIVIKESELARIQTPQDLYQLISEHSKLNELTTNAKDGH